MKTNEEVGEYVDWCLKNGAVPRLRGYFPFKILMEQGRIAPYYTTIRIMYSGLADIGYYINENGLLEKVGADDPVALDPEDVLSEEKCPDGWEPEMLRPKK